MQLARFGSGRSVEIYDRAFLGILGVSYSLVFRCNPVYRISLFVEVVSQILRLSSFPY